MGSDFIFDCDAYLERIGVDVPIVASEDCLEALHRAHVYTIPFENFDILLGRGVDLSMPHVFSKIIRQPRGGYCFELNGLFLYLLQCLGFQAIPLLARVHNRGKPSGRHHQLSLVTIKGREWIADVGFGANGLHAPVPFETMRTATQDGLEYRLIASPPYGTMLQVLEAGLWQNLYSFDLEHVCEADIYSGNHYTSTSPWSFFTWSRVANLPTSTGRVSLNDFSLTVVAGGVTEVMELEHNASYLERIREYFGIVIDEPYASLQPLHQKRIDNDRK